jgi:hypothetical protein
MPSQSRPTALARALPILPWGEMFVLSAILLLVLSG